MPTFDDRKNLAISNVVTPPSPAVSGTSNLVITTGHGARFSGTPPYNLTVGPPNVVLTPDNSEIIRVTAKSGDTFTTIARAQEGSTARTIAAGDVIYQGPTDKTLDDIEAVLTAGFPVDTGAWTSYTPTWLQGATNITKTVNYAKYMKVGRMVVASVQMTATGAGTASNQLTVSLPFTRAAGANVMGSFWFNDTGVGGGAGTVVPTSNTTVAFLIGGFPTGTLGTFGFTAAIASGDYLLFVVTYEADS